MSEKKPKEYHVNFKAILDGYVNVLAKNKQDAYVQVRTALEPRIDGAFEDNDTLFLGEKYEIEPKMLKDRKASKETD